MCNIPGRLSATYRQELCFFACSDGSRALLEAFCCPVCLSTCVLGRSQVAPEGVDAMVAELNAKQAQRAAFSRRRAFRTDADVDYINSRNAHFNKKVGLGLQLEQSRVSSFRGGGWAKAAWRCLRPLSVSNSAEAQAC